MGGYGSGGWNASGRPTTADVLRLDVSRLKKVGALTVGWVGNWQWSRDGEGIGNIDVGGSVDGVVLNYRSRVGGGDWTTYNERIAISWKPCRFGGQRPFLRCPSCARGVLYLYGWGRYLCRHCHGLSYPSQRERESDRAQRKANRIRVQLGGEPGWQNTPPRPKGMHWRTYDCLIDKIVLADALTQDVGRRLLLRLKRTTRTQASGYRAQGETW